LKTEKYYATFQKYEIRVGEFETPKFSTRYIPDRQQLLQRAEHAYHELTKTPSNPPVLVSLQRETSLSTQLLRVEDKL